MRVAFLDCFAGIAGDMFLGALIDAGVPAEVLQKATSALRIGATLRVEKVDRSGISSTKVHVLEHGEPADAKAQTYESSHAPSHRHESANSQTGFPSGAYSQQPKTQHMHKGGHSHAHTHADDVTNSAGAAAENASHPHEHGRSLTAIRDLIQRAPLDAEVKATSIRAFELLGNSEARIHNVPVDAIHFHEVGAVDAIVDIVAASAGVHHLKIGKWYSSAVNVGGGMVQCAHGNFPVPAPATADLLRGVPTYSAHLQKELVTPTGAALLRALDAEFVEAPVMRVESIGYGAGARNPPGFPNVLRLNIGVVEEAAIADSGAHARAEERFETFANHSADTVTVLETALDDLSPQVLAYVAEKALAAGALDVMLTSVVMKKGRPGTLLTILAEPSDSASLQALLLRETSTLGVRIRREHRVCLDRSHVAVETPFGAVRVKVGSQDGVERNAAPEFEDCRAAAESHSVPLKVVQQAAISAFRQGLKP